MAQQTTIARQVETSGIGLHTAVPGHIRLVPAPADTGIVFRRTDLDNFPIAADVRSVARVSYATSLMRQGVLISTTEHVLAALYSCSVDNVFVDLDAIEVPILDGSSQPFVAMLDRAGVRGLRRERRYLSVLRLLDLCGGARYSEIYPADKFGVRCLVDYPHPAVGRQEVEILVSRETFSLELAPARTFGFVKVFDGLRATGLIRGGSVQNE